MFNRGNNPITDKYWTDEDFAALETVSDFSQMYEQVALSILNRMPDNLGQVCGPISTGGAGSIEANLIRFDQAIKQLQSTGVHIFDQMYFEWPMQRVKVLAVNNPQMGQDPILTDFYEPLFRSGKISTFYFLPDWQTSRGANWEYNFAKELGIEVKFL